MARHAEWRGGQSHRNRICRRSVSRRLSTGRTWWRTATTPQTRTTRRGAGSRRQCRASHRRSVSERPLRTRQTRTTRRGAGSRRQCRASRQQSVSERPLRPMLSMHLACTVDQVAIGWNAVLRVALIAPPALIATTKLIGPAEPSCSALLLL